MSTETWTTTPIIVVGINRSGTKWLSNEIAAHPDVACIQSDLHGGIVESNMLTDFGRGFDLSTEAGYERLLDFWHRTHFFDLAGGDVEWLKSLSPRPANSVEAFRHLMEAFASRSGRRFWVQKIAPRDAGPCLDTLVDAKVIVIKRSDVETVRSKIRLDAMRGVKTKALRAGMSQGIQARLVDEVIQKREPLLVKYETLLADRGNVMSSVFRFVGLEPVEVSSSFSPNTSFRRSDDRRQTLDAFGEATVRMAVGLCRLLPLSILLKAQRRLTRRSDEIIPGTFAHQET